MSDFDAKAALWDSQAYRVERAQAIAAKIAAAVSDLKDRTVLDFGCGTGLLGFALLEACLHITFADLSSKMLDQVTLKLAGVPPGRGAVRNLEEESLGSGYGLVASLMVLHHIEDLETTVEGLAAAVAPGGWLCLCDLDTEDGSFHPYETVPHNGFERARIEGLYRRAGFSVAESSTGFVNRKVVAGQEREYPVFFLLGQKPA